MNHRYDFIYLFDATDANPNGDPDAGNLPRLDSETGQGLITDVCIKRKVRDYVQTVFQDDQHQIFVRSRKPLNPLIKDAAVANDLPTYEKKAGWDTDKAKKRSVSEIRVMQKWLCERYYDIRTFGAVLSTGPNAGQLRGPVQLAFSRSIDPIVSSEHAITRLTDVDEEEGEMGRKFTVPYGLYRTHGTVNPFLGDQTGFTDDGSDSDLELLFQALEKAFDFDASAARPAGSMAARLLLVFRHDGTDSNPEQRSQQAKLGCAPSHSLFDRLKIESFEETPTEDGKPPRKFADYASRITFDGEPLDEVAKPGESKDLGNGITLIRRI